MSYSGLVVYVHRKSNGLVSVLTVPHRIDKSESSFSGDPGRFSVILRGQVSGQPYVPAWMYPRYDDVYAVEGKRRESTLTHSRSAVRPGTPL
jgi:hypothetical protein